MTRDRLLVSVTLALAIHAVVFVLLQLFVKFQSERLPEYSGPMYVVLEQELAIQQVQEPAPVAPTETPVTKAPAAREEVKAPAAQLPPAATVQPADQPPPMPKGPALRMEGAPAQSEEVRPPLPAGEGFAIPSREPTLPPSGLKAAGTQTSASEAVKPQAPSEQGPSVSLDKLDKTLAQTRPAGTQGAGAATGAASPARPGTGASVITQDGIPIFFDDPALGREPTYSPKPEIPEWVSKQGLRLTVEVSFVLTPQGVVQKPKIEKSSGHSDVDAAVLEALRRWKFKPVASTANVKGLIPYLIVPR